LLSTGLAGKSFGIVKPVLPRDAGVEFFFFHAMQSLRDFPADDEMRCLNRRKLREHPKISSAIIIPTGIK
jgi:hypothetical protein